MGFIKASLYLFSSLALLGPTFVSPAHAMGKKAPNSSSTATAPTDTTSSVARAAELETGVFSTLYANAALGEQTTAIILVNFKDDPTQPLAPNYFSALGNRLDRFVQAESYGLASAPTTVLGWWTLPAIKNNPDFSNCDLGGKSFAALHNAVVDEATEQGVNLKTFQRLIIYYQYDPKENPCHYAGAGNALPSYGGFKGEAQIQVKYANGWGLNRAVGTIQHEFGHTLGFEHPSVWSCGSNQIDASCLVGEGRSKLIDPWDQMASWSEYNAVEKYSIGWIRANEVTTITQDGTYTLYPEELKTSPTKLLTFKGVDPRNHRLMPYYIEMRQPLEADGSPIEVSVPTSSAATPAPVPPPQKTNGVGGFLKNFFTAIQAPLASTQVSIDEINRSPLDFEGPIDHLGNVAQGVLIRTAHEEFYPEGNPTWVRADLINASAERFPSVENDIASNHNAALTVGETFTDPTTGVQVTLLSLTGGNSGSASVQVHFPNGKFIAPPLEIGVADPSVNTGGEAKIVNCPGCLSGKVATGVGSKGSLWFNNLEEDAAGSYKLDIQYNNPDAAQRKGLMQVNNEAPMDLLFPPTGSGLGSVSATIQLNAGASNTLVIYGAESAGDVDKIEIAPTNGAAH